MRSTQQVSRTFVVGRRSARQQKPDWRENARRPASFRSEAPFGRRVRKPSSVSRSRRRRRAGDHSSRLPVTEELEQHTRKLGRAALERFPIRSCSGWGLPCDLRCRRPGELLPRLFTLTGPPRGSTAVRSLWHCPRGRPHQALPGTLPCGARTFLPQWSRDRLPATAWTASTPYGYGSRAARASRDFPMLDRMRGVGSLPA